MNRKIKNPFGLVDGVLYHVKDITKGCEVFCPECGSKLIVRDGNKMVKHLSHDLRNDEGCSNESIVHKYVKKYLFERITCLSISEHKIIFNGDKMVLSDGESLSVKSKYLEWRCPDANYIPDICVILEGNYYVAIEVCYKNPKDEQVLKQVLSKSKIDIVIEINVSEEDLIEFDIGDLIARSEVIYNEFRSKYRKAKNQIINKCTENKHLKTIVSELPIEENSKLKDMNSKLKKNIKECQIKINESEKLCKFKEIENRGLKRMLFEYEKALKSTSPYYNEFMEVKTILISIYKDMCSNNREELDYESLLCSKLKEDINYQWMQTLMKIGILIDGYRDIDSEINFDEKEFINQSKLKMLSDNKVGFSSKDYQRAIDPIIRQVEKSRNKFKGGAKTEIYVDEIKRLEKLLKDAQEELKGCNNRTSM